MSERIKGRSRSLLEYQPDIGYIEPDVVSDKPEGLHKTPTDPNRGLVKAKAVQQFAKNIEALAEAAQLKADELSSGFCVELDPSNDYAAIMAMRRHFPEERPSTICYEQYKECKEAMRKVANGVSDKVLAGLSGENLDNELNALDNALSIEGGGDFSSLLNLVGPKNSNRPENDKTTQLVEPIDMAEFQDSMLRYLANLLWKKFIKPVIPLPPGISFLPDEIAPLPKGAPTPEQLMGQ